MCEFNPQPKPTRSRKQERAAETRADQKRLRWLHAYCTERDGACRVPGCIFRYKYASQLAHLWQWKRAKTVGQAPEARHPTGGAMMLCLIHHQLEDANRLILLPRSLDHADGVVLFVLDGRELGESRPKKKGPGTEAPDPPEEEQLT